MNGVFTCALQKILGAIKGIKNPKPFGRQGLALRELVLGGLLAQQCPVRIGKCSCQTIQKPLIHCQVRSRHWAFATVIDTQCPGETMGRLLPPRIGPQDVGGTPAEATQFGKQCVLADTGRQNGGAGHQNRFKRWPL